MGEAFGGFSIREHALKMRSLDVVKCWPFNFDSDKMAKEDMAAMLPPMAVTKFRYWRDELEAMKKKQQPNKDMLENSTGWELDEQQDDVDKLEVGLDNMDDKSDDELVCPVCKIFTAATVNAMNAHIDSCLAQTSRKSMKGKSRPPKKRSIVEIFAETPKIDKTEAQEDVIRFGHRKGFAASNAKTSLKGMRMSTRKMFKKKWPKVGTTTTKKRSKELKLCSLPKTSKGVCDSSCHRRSTLEILDAAPSRIKKPKPKFLKKTCTQPFKSMAKKQNTKLSDCGILKNCRKTTENSSSTICNRSGSGNNRPPSSQQLKRHVKFSDALGALADKKHHAECLTELTAVQSINDDNALSIMEKEAETQQASEKRLLYGTRDQGKINHPPGEFVAPSQAAVHDGRYTVSCEGIHDSSECDLYIGNPRFCSTLGEEHHFTISTKSGSCAARFPSSSGRLTDHSEDQALSLAATSSLAGGRAYLQPSLSSFPLDENQNGRLSQLHAENISGRAIGRQSHFSPSSVQLVANFSNHPEWMQKKPRFEEAYNHGNYCGLPLNSQGELIQLGSGSYSGNNHRLMSNTVPGSSTTLPFHSYYLPSQTGNYVNERTNRSRMMQKDQLNLFPLRSYVKENLEKDFPSRSNLANLGIAGRADVIYPDSERRSQMGCVLGSDQSSLNMCYQGCHRQYDLTTTQRGKGINQLQNHDGNTLNNPQPTMRLMGKDVAVGQNNKGGTYLEEGKSLADKEFIMGYHPSISTQNDYFEKSSFMENCSSHAGAGRIREPVPDFFRIQKTQPLETSSMMRYPEPPWETNSGLGKGSLRTNQYPSSEQYFFTDPPSTPEMFNQAKNFRDQFGPVTDFLRASSQSPVVSSTFQETCQHMQSRSGLKQSLAKARGSAFDFPFLHPDNGVNFQQFLSHPSHQNQSSHCPQAYSDIVCKSHPPSTFGIGIPSGPEILHQAGAYDPHNSMTSHMLMTISPFPESAPHHPFVPILPSDNATYGMEPKDMKLKAAMPMSDPYQCSEMKKRPADRGYILTRPSKMLNINAQERMRALENFRTGIPGGTEIPVDPYVHDFTFYSSHTGNREHDTNVTAKHLLGNPFVIDGSKSVANAKSGTIKLSAGAKHILKPSQKVDQDKFTSMHSTVPLSTVTYSDNVMEWQKSTRTFQP